MLYCSKQTSENRFTLINEKWEFFWNYVFDVPWTTTQVLNTYIYYEQKKNPNITHNELLEFLKKEFSTNPEWIEDDEMFLDDLDFDNSFEEEVKPISNEDLETLKLFFFEEIHNRKIVKSPMESFYLREFDKNWWKEPLFGISLHHWDFSKNSGTFIIYNQIYGLLNDDYFGWARTIWEYKKYLNSWYSVAKLNVEILWQIELAFKNEFWVGLYEDITLPWIKSVYFHLSSETSKQKNIFNGLYSLNFSINFNDLVTEKFFEAKDFEEARNYFNEDKLLETHNSICLIISKVSTLHKYMKTNFLKENFKTIKD